MASQLESQTEIIPDEILGPLVQGAIEYVDRFAGYLLEANDAVDGIRKQECDRRARFEQRSARGCTNTFRRPMPSPEASSSMAWYLLPN